MPDPQWVFLVHLGATLFMTGLIWFVQVVHYPMFSAVGRERFAEYELVHSRRTTWLVAPVMLVEAASGIILVMKPPLEGQRGALLAAIALLAAVWLSTAFLQVPRHRTLESGYDETAHRALVSTNVIRTVGWSARAVILLLVAGFLIQKGTVS